MMIVTVDSKRRITLPQEVGILPGQQVGVAVVGQRVEITPITILPREQFEAIVRNVESRFADVFRDLAAMPERPRGDPGEGPSASETPLEDRP